MTKRPFLHKAAYSNEQKRQAFELMELCRLVEELRACQTQFRSPDNARRLAKMLRKSPQKPSVYHFAVHLHAYAKRHSLPDNVVDVLKDDTLCQAILHSKPYLAGRTLLAHHRNWLAEGDWRALVDRRTQRYSRQRLIEGEMGEWLTDQWMEIFADPRHPSKEEAGRMCLAELAKRPSGTASKLPSPQTIIRHCEATTDSALVTARRLGHDAAFKHRPVNAGIVSIAIGQRLECDEGTTDVLVRDHNGEPKPLRFAIIQDHASRKILAFWVGIGPLTGPNALRLMSAALRDQHWHDQVRENHVETAFALNGRPTRIVCDKGGPFIAGLFKENLNNLNVDLQSAGTRCPTHKATIERAIGVSKLGLAKAVTGVTHGRDNSPEYNPKALSLLGFEDMCGEFKRLIDQYNNTKNKALLYTSPNQKWADLSEIGLPERISDEDFDALTAFAADVEITREGVNVDYCNYKSEEVAAIFRGQRHLKGWTAERSINNIGHMRLVHPLAGVISASIAQGDRTGWSLEDLQDHKKRMSEGKRDSALEQGEASLRARDRRLAKQAQTVESENEPQAATTVPNSPQVQAMPKAVALPSIDEQFTDLFEGGPSEAFSGADRISERELMNELFCSLDDATRLILGGHFGDWYKFKGTKGSARLIFRSKVDEFKKKYISAVALEKYIKNNANSSDWEEVRNSIVREKLDGCEVEFYKVQLIERLLKVTLT